MFIRIDEKWKSHFQSRTYLHWSRRDMYKNRLCLSQCIVLGSCKDLGSKENRLKKKFRMVNLKKKIIIVLLKKSMGDGLSFYISLQTQLYSYFIYFFFYINWV